MYLKVCFKKIKFFEVGINEALWIKLIKKGNIYFDVVFVGKIFIVFFVVCFFVLNNVRVLIKFEVMFVD